MKHALYDREDGLAHCRVCGGAEGTLPKDCPERSITEAEATAIWNGKLNFIDGKWVWVSEPPIPAPVTPKAEEETTMWDDGCKKIKVPVEKEAAPLPNDYVRTQATAPIPAPTRGTKRKGG